MKSKNISEAKKSELVRKEENIEKGEQKLKAANDKLQKDIKEFSNLIDKKMADFNKEKSDFDNISRKKNNDLAKEAIRLEGISKSQNKEQEAVVKLKDQYTKGFDQNAQEASRLKKLSSENNTRGIKINEEEDRLSGRDKEIAKVQGKLDDKSEYIAAKLEDLESQLLALEKKRISIEEFERKVETDKQEIIQLKLNYNKGMLKNDSEKRRLANVDRDLGKRETSIIEARESLEKKESDHKRIIEEVERKIAYAENKIEELNKKIKKNFQVKEEAEYNTIKARKLSLSLAEKEKELVALQEVIEGREKKVADEKIRLSEWNDSLTSLQADLRDQQRLIRIEARNVKEKLAVVQKIRKEIYNKGGN